MIVFTPKTAMEAAALKAANPGAAVLAGGTDLLAQWSAGAARPESLIVVSNISELNFIRETGGKIEIGACAAHGDIASDARVNRYLPALAGAASSIGAPAIRNMGTIGGNIANASPAADLPPALMIYDATV
ncbi:MAG: FAD binding domain-containing protein, partial [Deltaproteobacteria bacterium]|nr:FAD binding domain-containing protein [Deltaproteobacteria bacterium]